MSGTGPAGPTRATGPAADEMVRMARSVALHPHLWWAALGALHRLAAPGWWKRSPYLPLPDGRLWEFRMVTAYGGDGGREPDRGDLISYLEWCRSTRTPRRPLRSAGGPGARHDQSRRRGPARSG